MTPEIQQCISSLEIEIEYLTSSFIRTVGIEGRADVLDISKPEMPPTTVKMENHALKILRDNKYVEPSVTDLGKDENQIGSSRFCFRCLCAKRLNDFIEASENKSLPAWDIGWGGEGWESEIRKSGNQFEIKNGWGNGYSPIQAEYGLLFYEEYKRRFLIDKASISKRVESEIVLDRFAVSYSD